MTGTTHEAMKKAFEQQELPYEPAELHGLLCGALVASPFPTEAAILSRLANHVGEERWPTLLVGDWKQLREAVIKGYQSDDLSLELLLPDESNVAAKVAALSAWCEGFMAGFAENGYRELPDIITEALGDLMAISRAEIPDDPGEEERSQLAQIEEHCRMIALMMFTEMAKKGA